MPSHVGYNFSIRPLEKQEVDLFEKMVGVIQAVFENDYQAIPSKAHFQKLLSNPQFIAIAAFEGEEIIGGLTAHELPLTGKEGSEMFLYDIAVKPEYQRHGIGKQLIEALKDYCRRHHIAEMFVAAHEEDDHAVKFYHAAGGRAENTVFFTFSDLDARHGKTSSDT